MEALLISFVAVAIAEIGDKTQLIALCLASRFHKPVPILLGILAATLLNHALAALAGHWVGSLLTGNILHGLLCLSFIGAAVWAFIPDKLDGDPSCNYGNHGVFLTSAVTFFIAEIGDKTQLATAALAAQFHPLYMVVIATTLGMMAANAPVVLASHAISSRVSLKLVRAVSGIVFAGLAVYELSCISLSQG